MNMQPVAARQQPGRFKTGVLVVLLPLLLIGAALYLKAEQIVLGAEGYIFGFPLVIMDVTRANSPHSIGPQNELRRVRKFPDASFRDVVRPNVDTLYSSAFIRMAQGPWVFEMPPNQQRYEVMPFMDAWTNVFAAPGTRSSGTGGGGFLLAGPLWQGVVPDGLTLLRAPTDLVWLIGRTQTNGVADYATVHQLQDGLTLRRLSDWQAGRVAPTVTIAPTPSADKTAPPIRQMQTMDVQDFFSRLAKLMVANPPTAADAPMLAKLARLGIAPGQPPAWGITDRWAVGLGRQIADWTVARELKKRPTVRGWITPPPILGNYGTFYNTRAVVAMIGLGANLPADAMYPSATVDGTGAALHGKHRYRLHFAKGSLPPVHAFWSITAYGPDDFFVRNPLQRFALGDRDPLQFNPDGSLDLLVQAQPPDAAQRSNWLPVQADAAFTLTVRLYWPKAQALDGHWGMPGLERLN